MDVPKYFLSVFGKPKPPNKDTVESGIYHPDSKFVPFPAKLGDILLIYCTIGYKEYSMSVPGVGIVLQINNREIHYRFLPLTKPISKDELDDYLDLTDKKKFSNIRFSSYWFFEISRDSFLRSVKDHNIFWEQITGLVEDAHK
jgi:hypothetical protein